MRTMMARRTAVTVVVAGWVHAVQVGQLIRSGRARGIRSRTTMRFNRRVTSEHMPIRITILAAFTDERMAYEYVELKGKNGLWSVTVSWTTA